MESVKNVWKVSLFLMFFLCIGLVSAVPPFTSTANAGTSIEIGFPVAETIKANTTYTLHIHIFNGTENYLDDSVTDCYLHLYDTFGDHVYEEKGNFSSNGLDFEWEDIPSITFSTLGIHSYILSCNNTETIGFARGGFDVTKTGRVLTIANTLTYFFSALILVFLMYGLVFIISQLPSGDSVNDENEIIQFSQLKHLRSILWIGVWGVALTIVFIIGNFTLMFMINDMLGNVFMNLFILMFIVTIIGVPVQLIWIWYKMYRDAIKQKLLERGISQFESL